MKNAIIFYFLFIIFVPLGFLLINIPSNIYGYSLFLMLPVRFIIRMFVEKPSKTSIPSVVVIAIKLRTPFVLLVIPVILYLYVSALAGYIFFGLMAIYLLIRHYSGQHQETKIWFESWRDIEKIIAGSRDFKIKYNIPLTLLIFALSLLAIFLGNLFGGEIGIWIGLSAFLLVWVITPYARETIVSQPDKDSTKQD